MWIDLCFSHVAIIVAARLRLRRGLPSHVHHSESTIPLLLGGNCFTKLEGSWVLCLGLSSGKSPVSKQKTVLNKGDLLFHGIVTRLVALG